MPASATPASRWILSSSWKRKGFSCVVFDRLALADVDLIYLRQEGGSVCFVTGHDRGRACEL